MKRSEYIHSFFGGEETCAVAKAMGRREGAVIRLGKAGTASAAPQVVAPEAKCERWT